MKKFLVVQLARFGDIIQSKRLILALSEQGEVTLLIDSSLTAAAKLVYPYAECVGLHVSKADVQEIWQENKKIFHWLQTQNFDEVYALNHSPLCQIINSLFEEDRLVGYSRHKGYSRHSLWVKMAFRWLGSRNKTPINLVDFWGLFAEKPYPADKVNPKAQGKGHGLGIVLSGQNARRSLPPEYYAKIIPVVFQRLLSNSQLKDKKIYLLGTDREKKFADGLLFHIPQNYKNFVVNLAGKTNFTDLKTVLENLELLLSPDTGTAHFAGHLGTPVEGFYLSSANLFETGPYGEGHCIWQAYLPCTPCGEFQPCTKLTKNGPQCLQAFGHPHFLYHLLHKDMSEQKLQMKPLEHIIPYFSGFSRSSEKFSTFLSWHSPLRTVQDIQREEEKNILENYCLACKDTDIPMELHSIKDNTIYADTDFMLPQKRP